MRWIFLLSISFSAHAEFLCARSLNGSPTQNLLVYFENLLEANELGGEDLRGLIQDPLHNPFADRDGTIAKIHGRAVAEYLEAGEVDPQEVSGWAGQRLAQLTKQSQSRSQNARETKSHREAMRFQRIEPGSVGEARLLHPIEVMRTPVTQAMWLEVMRNNPSRFHSGDESTVVLIDGGRIAMQPNHPVEQVTWFEAAAFANAMSVREGLKEAYDLREYNHWANAPGSLQKAAPEPKLAADVYQTQGYRLPTFAEASYLIGIALRVPGPLRETCWGHENSGDATRSVASLRAVSISGNDFFDLLGNVTFFADGPSDCVIMGFNYQASGLDFDADGVGFKWIRNLRDHGLGLRLVRTVK